MITVNVDRHVDVAVLLGIPARVRPEEIPFEDLRARRETGRQRSEQRLPFTGRHAGHYRRPCTRRNRASLIDAA